MAVTITKPAFNIRDKLAEIGANIATSQMPSGTIINTAYSEYDEAVTVSTTAYRKYATVWTPHIYARESGSDFLVMSYVQGYASGTPNGTNTGIQRVVDDAWITLANEVRNSDAVSQDNWMGMLHNTNLAAHSFSHNRFAMDTYRNYKAGQKIQYDIAVGCHASSGASLQVNYNGYNSQCVSFIMEIKQ